MKVLLDTCAFIWFNLEADELSARALEIFENLEEELYLSVVSSWEIAVKYSSGRLYLPEPPEVYIPDRRNVNRIHPLPLEENAVFQEPKLPRLHGDPFDRMLVCQAIVGGMAILTPDEHIAQYPVRTIW